MAHVKNVDRTYIEKHLQDNFISLMPIFYEMQSLFLSGIYKRYGDLEGGHIVIYFARDLHLEIMRKREKDMNFDLSLSKFWENHGNIFQNKKKIISIANHTGLPKETARRKIIQLIKKKHIKKLDKNKILWEPDPHFKDTYISIIEEQINSLSKFIYQVTKVIGFNSPISRIQKELKDNYSFHWYHYLTFQLQYIKYWQERFKDLEMVLIALQTLIQTIRYISSNVKGDINTFLLNKIPKNIDTKNANISATSISEITGIPRATCIRKLEKFVKMNILEKDNLSKRYYLLTNQLAVNPVLSHGEVVKATTSIFSDFCAVFLKNINK